METTVGAAARLLHTEFALWRRAADGRLKVRAADEYTLPPAVAAAVDVVLGLHGVPLGGDFRILVDKKPNIAWLPSTSTCYNTLHLPPYESKRDLKVKLKTAIRNSMNGGTGEL